MRSLIRLGDHTTKVGSGQTPSGGYRSYSQTGIPLIRSQNVLMGAFNDEGLVYISQAIDDSMSGSRVLGGDVLLNITGASIGRVCVVPDAICPANVNQHVCIIRCVDSLHPEYVASLLASPRFQDLIWESQAGGTRQALTKQMIEDFEIPWIPIEKQRQIAADLKAQLAEVDKARQAAEAQLRDAEALSVAIHREIEKKLFSESEIRLFGSFVKAYRNGFGKRPKEGECGPIVLRIADVSSGLISVANPRHGEVTEKEAETYKLNKGDLLFIRVNGAKEIVGKCCVVDETVPEGTIFNDHLIRVQITDELNPDFARLCVSLPRARQLIEEVASTSAGQLTINQQLLDRLEIPVFSVDEQIEAVSKLQGQLDQLAVLREAVSSKINDINLLPQKILAQAFQSIPECGL